MSSPFSLRLYVHDVGRADAFDKCTIPKTNGHDNRQSTVAGSIPDDGIIYIAGFAKTYDKCDELNAKGPPHR